VFSLTLPSEDEVRRFISKQKESGFSYPEVGASATAVPRGYTVDHNRIRLGRGEDTWQRAVQAIRQWRMFNMPWVSLHWPNALIQVGTGVAVSVHHFGFYSLNACRIVYTVDEEGSVNRFGFAYGTLAEHAESGEERFTVEWNRADDTVWYDILAFSRPQQMDCPLCWTLPFSAVQTLAMQSPSVLRLRKWTGPGMVVRSKVSDEPVGLSVVSGLLFQSSSSSGSLCRTRELASNSCGTPYRNVCEAASWEMRKLSELIQDRR
jgi:uncharacterized protein (UPF0548 family)